MQFNKPALGIPITFIGAPKLVKLVWEKLFKEEKNHSEGISDYQRLVTPENYAIFLRFFLSLCDAKLFYAQKRVEHSAWIKLDALHIYEEIDIKRIKFLSVAIFKPLAQYIKCIGCFRHKDIIIVPQLMKTGYGPLNGAVNYSREAIKYLVASCSDWIYVDSEAYKVAQSLNHLPHISWKTRVIEIVGYSVQQARLSHESILFWGDDESFPYPVEDDIVLKNIIEGFPYIPDFLKSLDIGNGEGSALQIVRFPDDVETFGDEIRFYTAQEIVESDLRLAAAFLFGVEYGNSVCSTLTGRYEATKWRGNICWMQCLNSVVSDTECRTPVVSFDTSEIMKLKIIEPEQIIDINTILPEDNPIGHGHIKYIYKPQETDYPANKFPYMPMILPNDFVMDNENRKPVSELCLPSRSDKVGQALMFYTEDNTQHTLMIEPNLRADHVCEILALKNSLMVDEFWSLMEQWTEIGVERFIEDHEHLLVVNENMNSYPHETPKRFALCKNESKYDMFENPMDFFPSDMVDLSGFLDTESHSPESIKEFVLKGRKCPVMFGQVWVRESGEVWTKAFLLLKDDRLYFAYKVQVMANFICKGGNASDVEDEVTEEDKEEEGTDDLDRLHLLAVLTESVVYTTLNAKNHFFQAPAEFGICIRPITTDSNLENEAASAPTEKGDVASNLRCIVCESERIRICWLAAMRLAKYGKQLRENYRIFRNKQQRESENGEDYTRYSVPNETVWSRVPMDFTGNVGRIVEDPEEVKEITELEEKPVKQKIRPNLKEISQRLNVSQGVPINEPWFHGQLSRDQSILLINRHIEDGVFLVRESQSNPGIYVLTFKCGGKVIHSQIQPIVEHGRETFCYSLDNGVTKFYDLTQLIEFYQLNAGCLPTRLVHYVVFETPETTLINTEDPNATIIHVTPSKTKALHHGFVGKKFK